LTTDLCIVIVVFVTIKGGIMTSITHHQDKKTGAVYRYSVESYWDKEKKAPRNKQVYLGKVDPDTGELIPARRKKKENRKK